MTIWCRECKCIAMKDGDFWISNGLMVKRSKDVPIGVCTVCYHRARLGL